MSHSHHEEAHYVERTGWLRASVLGANDGIVSVASLLVGVGASNPDGSQILLAGVAALVAGTLSMAAGEFISVSSQADLEAADLETERLALAEHPQEESAELAAIYVERGLTPGLADEVAQQLMAHDALGAHARDELQLVEEQTRPLLAAVSSGTSFAVGAVWPLIPALLAPAGTVVPVVIVATVVGLAVLGWASARAGGAPVGRAMARVLLWGCFAMAVTGGVGWVLGVSV